MRTRLLVTLALLSLVLPAVATAQDDEHPRGHRARPRDPSPGLREVDSHSGRERRQGFWLSAGLGVGGEAFDANDGLGWSDDHTGGVAALKLGGTVSPNLLLGAEVNGWGLRNYNNQDYDRTLANLMGIIQWYPSRTGGFWLRGGLGFAHSELNQYLAGGATLRTQDNGTALAVGLGYDLPVSRKVSITPNLDFTGQRFRDFDERIVSLGLAVTFH
jgi:hypothetical protein